MRAYFVAFAAVVLTACGGADKSGLMSAGQSPREYWEEIAPTCAGYPSKEGCDDGDMALFGGLLCASGDERGCALVRDAQGADGRWWRSPRRNPGNLGQDKSFSRDMSMGVLLYLATTRDTGAARRWVNWIEHNRPCLTRKPGGGCLIRGPSRFCTDEENQSCTVTPANWALLGRVFEELGLDRNDEMRRYRGADGDTMVLEAQHAEPGYELHLTAVEVLLKWIMQDSRALRDKAAQAMQERQAENPFFGFLRYGASDALAMRIVDLCPKPGPSNGARRHQWAWERDTASRAWEESVGWDCLFMTNMLEKHLPL